MILNIVRIIIGLIAVLWGADKFTNGASSLARRLNVPEIVVGLTIVAFGTSAPELTVSFFSALKGSTGMAIGNIIGSNIFNTLAIVGCTALVAPILIQKNSVKKDIPFAIGASLLLSALMLDGEISRVDSILLLVGFAAFMVYTLRLAKKGKAEESKQKVYSMGGSIVLIVVGLVAIIWGADEFTNGACGMARSMNVSDAVIGLTVVACGTSLPELATSLTAARKGQSGIAIGNVIGSNVFNVLFILGLTGVICPMNTKDFSLVDLAVFAGSILLLWLMCRTKYKVERWEGGVMAVAFVGYMVWLVMNV